MKRLLKTAFALVAAGGGLILSGSAFAAFPAPYCVRGYSTSVEPITNVAIDGINNPSSATVGGTPADEDFTAIIGQLAPGGIYPISVQGNNDGNFKAGVAVYIDWDGNGTFDAPESYFVGVLANSTGSDGKSVGATITVPLTATPGMTRMRVAKQYGATPTLATTLACGTTGFGQAEDYTVNIDVNAPVPPSLSMAFAPTNGAVGASSTLTLTLGNSSSSANALSADFTNTLPAGLVIAALPATATTCTAGTVTTTANSVTLTNGASIPVGGCTVKVDVSAATAGIYVNTIAAGALNTVSGPGPGATAVYQATQAGVATYNTGFETPTFVAGPIASQGGWGRTSASTVADVTIATVNPDTGAQHLRIQSSATGASADTAISPTQAIGTTAYTVASAKLAINQGTATDGTEMDFAPQDPAASSITTRVRFLRPTAGVNKIQVLDPNGGGPGVSGYVDTGAFWTAGAYFDLKIIANRATQKSEICINGASIFTVDGFAKNIANLAISNNRATAATLGNTLDIDNVVIDNTNDGNCAPTVTHVVTPSVGTPSGTITPATAQTVNDGATTSFTLAADAGFHVDTVGGTCGGTLAGAVFTTAAVTADCTVIANFAADVVLTPTLSKTFTPTSVLTDVTSVATITLTNPSANPAVLTAPLNDALPAGLTVVSATTSCGIIQTRPNSTNASVGLPAGIAIPANGSCTLDIVVKAAAAGTYVNTLAAGALQTDQGNNAQAASATLTVAPATFTVTPSIGTPSGNISPSTPQTVNNGATTSFTLTPDAGFHIDTVGGTCGGTLAGNVFTTAAATADCTVIANFAAGATFPAPYCAVTFPSSVEPITRVKFTGIDNVSSPAVGGSPALEDFLSVTGGDVVAGLTYSMTVEGNTDGGFTTKVKAYIDWNQNGVFEANEAYAIGSIVNSTGTDGVQAVANIAVPPTALGGTTRMRVIKKFGSTADPDPCNTTGYGQAEDYTLTVTAETGVPVASVSPASFDFTVEQGSTGNDTMVIGNSGTATLTYNITRALAARQAASASHKAKAGFNPVIAANDAFKAAMSGEVPMPQALDLLTASGGFPPMAKVILASDPACATTVTGMMSHDHGGAPENGYGWNASAGAVTRIADKFTPTSYPGTFNTVCLSLLTNAGVTSAAVKIVVFADDGAGGAPGTQLGSVDVTANNIGTGLVESYQAFDISSMNLSIASGSVYIGVEWDATAISGMFLGSDETSASAGGYSYTASSAVWDSIATAHAAYKAMYIRAVEGPAGPPGTGCDAPSNVPWLSVNPAAGNVSPMSSANVAVTVTPGALPVGIYEGLICVNTNDLVTPRLEVPVTLEVIPAAPLDLIFKDGFDGSAPGTYTTKAEFLTHVAAGSYENPFSDATPGESPPLSYTQGTIAYTVSSSIPDGDTGGGLYNDTGLISTNGSGAQIVVTFTGSPVTAVGGNFWATDVSVAANGLPIVITLSDGTTETFTSTGPTDFRGFTTAAPITTISIDAPNPSVPTDGSWATMDNLIVGGSN